MPYGDLQKAAQASIVKVSGRYFGDDPGRDRDCPDNRSEGTTEAR